MIDWEAFPVYSRPYERSFLNGAGVIQASLALIIKRHHIINKKPSSHAAPLLLFVLKMEKCQSELLFVSKLEVSDPVCGKK